MHDSTGITSPSLSLSLSPPQLLSSVECTNLYHRVVSLNFEQDICACFWHSSVAAEFSRHVAAHELQLCPINQPNSHWCCTLLLRPHPPHWNITGQSWTQLPEENMQVEAGTGHPASTWTSMQRWNWGHQHPAGAETEISTGAEECERQQRLLRCSSNKGEAKDRVSSLLDRDGEEEMMKCTEKPEVLNAFFAPVFSGKISSQVSHTPEATLWGKKHYQSQTN